MKYSILLLLLLFTAYSGYGQDIDFEKVLKEKISGFEASTPIEKNMDENGFRAQRLYIKDSLRVEFDIRGSKQKELVRDFYEKYFLPVLKEYEPNVEQIKERSLEANLWSAKGMGGWLMYISGEYDCAVEISAQTDDLDLLKAIFKDIDFSPLLPKKEEK